MIEELLDELNLHYTSDSVGNCFLTFSAENIKWDSSCIKTKSGVLIFSIYSVPVKADMPAFELCNELNVRICGGCFYLERGRLLIKSEVDLSDEFYAYDLFREGLNKHNAAALHGWKTAKIMLALYNVGKSVKTD